MRGLFFMLSYPCKVNLHRTRWTALLQIPQSLLLFDTMNNGLRHLKKLIILFYIHSGFPIFGQISPPGLGIAKTASWLAVGLRQSLDSTQKKQSMTYFGLGRMSDPNTTNSFKKPAIFIINQEFYNTFHKRWQYSAAISYRRQNEYLKQSPYSEANPDIKQELRIYGRLSHMWISSRFKFTLTYRQDFRKFFAPDFTEWSESYQFRSRLRGQLTVNLVPTKVHRLIVSAEALFSASRGEVQKSLRNFNYRESRLCVYYSHSPKQIPFVFNLGYMNNLLGNSSYTYVHFIALDIIWENPFTRIKRFLNLPVEHLE